MIHSKEPAQTTPYWVSVGYLVLALLIVLAFGIADYVRHEGLTVMPDEHEEQLIDITR